MKDTVFVIRHKVTKEHYVCRSGKSSWRKAGHAKLAWNQSAGYNMPEVKPIMKKSRWSNHEYLEYPLFAEQDVYEVFELKGTLETSEATARHLLTLCLGRLTDWELEKEVEAYLKENN